MADAKTSAPDPQYARPGSPVEARQKEVAREHLQRGEELGRIMGTPEGTEGPMTKGVKSGGSRVLAAVVGAFTGMSSDADAPAGVIASALAADHIQFFSSLSAEAKGMYKQRIRTARGHAAHRGWARLLLDRRRGLIAHGPHAPRATRSAGGNSTTRSSSGTATIHYHSPGQFRARASD